MMRSATISLLALCLLSGCGSRTILVPSGVTVKLGADTPAYIEVRDPATGQWVKSPNKVTLPRGWYVRPPLMPSTRP